MRVKEAMTKDPIAVVPEASIGAAIETMRTRGVRHLPVVDGAGQLVGIITDRDLRQATLAPALAEWLPPGARRRLEGLARAFEELRVRDAMTWGVVVTHPEAPLGHAALVMFERKVGSLPVVRDGRLVGILTERDVLRVLQGERTVGEYAPEGFLW